MSDSTPESTRSRTIAGDLLAVDRDERLAAGVHPLDRLARVGQRGRRVGLDHDDPAGQRARRLGAGEVQDLAEALRGDQPDAGALGLQHGVGGDGRAVHDVAERVRRRSRPRRRSAARPASTPCDGSAGVDGVLTRHCRCVLVVDEEQVGERPSHVHAQPIRHAAPLSCQITPDLAQRAAAPRRRPPAPPSTASVSAPTVQRAGVRTAPGVPLSFGTTPGTSTSRRAPRPRASTSSPRSRKCSSRVDVLGRVDRRAHHARLVDDPVELGGRVPRRPLADHLVEQVLVLAARVVGREALVVAQLRAGPSARPAAATACRGWPRSRPSLPSLER